jgi:hypothetical protein
MDSVAGEWRDTKQESALRWSESMQLWSFFITVM